MIKNVHAHIHLGFVRNFSSMMTDEVIKTPVIKLLFSFNIGESWQFWRGMWKHISWNKNFALNLVVQNLSYYNFFAHILSCGAFFDIAYRDHKP
jgi:hypothetical protein